MRVGKILFIGMGGGNDIFSTILAIQSLQELGWSWQECAIAGVLSPFHYHTSEAMQIPGVYKTKANSKRFVIRNNNPAEVVFIDSRMASMVESNAFPGISDVFGLSLEYGSEGVTEALHLLSKMYDQIVLVDIGGDCLFRGKADTHILTPMFDACVLRAFLDSQVEGQLFIAGPGTDGELEPEALKEVLSSAAQESHFLSDRVIQQWRKLYLGWIFPFRPGRTVAMTIKAFYTSAHYLVEDYEVRGRIGDLCSYHSFPQHIETDLCRKFYLVDPHKISNPFAVQSTSPLDWFVRTQVRQFSTNCEANLSYIRIGTRLAQFLTPSPLLSAEDRRALIRKGIQDLGSGVVDMVLLMKSDWQEMHSELEGGLIVNHGEMVSVVASY